VEPGELDLQTFEELLIEGHRALEGEDFESAARSLREAESLWRGRPLADLEFERFARIDIERLEELLLVAQEDRTEAELALGRHAIMVPELEARVAEYPLRERSRGQLMLALYRCGRQADALETYRTGRSLMSEELALEPGPALRQLERSILPGSGPRSPRAPPQRRRHGRRAGPAPGARQGLGRGPARTRPDPEATIAPDRHGDPPRDRVRDRGGYGAADPCRGSEARGLGEQHRRR
jgi:DNA-binding SARP family transcriptional activator